jgi:hypothetical protein
MDLSSVRYKGSCADSLNINITNAITMLHDYYYQKVEYYTDILGDETIAAAKLKIGLNDDRELSDPGPNKIGIQAIRDMRETTDQSDE